MLESSINCGVCSVVINVICVKGFDLLVILTLGIRLRYSNLNKCITKLNDDDGILLERNAYWNPMEEYSNDIIYLDLCTRPFMSMFQMSGSGDDPLTLTPTGSRNPQGSSSTRPLGLPLTPQQHLQLSSPGISVRAYGTP